MNLLDGIKIYTLPGLAHLGTIKQDVYDETNVTLGIMFVEDEYVIAGDKGAIWMYNITILALIRHLLCSSPSG